MPSPTIKIRRLRGGPGSEPPASRDAAISLFNRNAEGDGLIVADVYSAEMFAFYFVAAFVKLQFPRTLTARVDARRRGEPETAPDGIAPWLWAV